MSSSNSLGPKMRIIHRYLGFFLVGIMAMYAISGMTLIFRNTDFLKIEKVITKDLQPNIDSANLAKELGFRQINITSQDENIINFENGTYNIATGKAEFTIKTLPFVLDKMTHLHKAQTSDPLFYFNIFFGLSLLFFVISSFWMFMPSTSVFKKGMYFTIAGIIMTLILIFV